MTHTCVGAVWHILVLEQYDTYLCWSSMTHTCVGAVWHIPVLEQYDTYLWWSSMTHTCGGAVWHMTHTCGGAVWLLTTLRLLQQQVCLVWPLQLEPTSPQIQHSLSLCMLHLQVILCYHQHVSIEFVQHSDHWWDCNHLYTSCDETRDTVIV